MMFAGRKEQGAGNDEDQEGYERVIDEVLREVEMKRMNLVCPVPYVTLSIR
jgi:hypothetical protein